MLRLGYLKTLSPLIVCTIELDELQIKYMDQRFATFPEKWHSKG